MLTLYQNGWGQYGEATMFEVLGLPQSQQALIANGGHKRQEWEILRIVDGVHGEWSEAYGSAAEALAALSRDFPQSAA